MVLATWEREPLRLSFDKQIVATVHPPRLHVSHLQIQPIADWQYVEKNQLPESSLLGTVLDIFTAGNGY